MGEVQLNIGDHVELSGGYDFEPLFLKSPPADKRLGYVVKFIEGQNTVPAAVVKLNEVIYGSKISGDIAVLELRHQDATWSDKSFTVHIELCDFIPDNKSWKDRQQGEWVEAAATLKKVYKEK